MTPPSVLVAPPVASGSLTALAQKVGGLAAVARRVRSPLRVVREWNQGGGHPGPASLVRLAELAKEHSVSLPWDVLTGTADPGASAGPAGALLPLVVKVGSLREIARLIGVCVGSVSRWNRGDGRPEARARARLAGLAAAHGLEAPFSPERRRVRVPGRNASGVLSELVSRVGSFSQVARAVGARSAAVRMWHYGVRVPRPRHRTALEAVCAAHGVVSPFSEEGAGRPAALRRFVRRHGHLPHNGPLNELILAVGSRSLLATTVGVTDETVGRWNRRRALPSLRQRWVLAKVADECRMESPFSIERDTIRIEQRALKRTVLEPLTAKLGGLSAVAAAVGAPLRLVRTWNRGRHMPAPAWRERLAELARGQGVEVPFAVDEPDVPAVPVEVCVRGPLAALIATEHGVRALAVAVGVGGTRVWRWNSGEVPDAAMRARLAVFAEARGLEPPFTVDRPTPCGPPTDPSPEARAVSSATSSR